jgi:antitoxin component of MazEF toxin-antitoxin module
MAVESLGFREGETISLYIENGALVIRPAKARFALADLVDEAQALTPPQALDDAPMGDELL